LIRSESRQNGGTVAVVVDNRLQRMRVKICEPVSVGGINIRELQRMRIEAACMASINVLGAAVHQESLAPSGD